MVPFRTTAVIPLYPCFRFIVIIALYLLFSHVSIVILSIIIFPQKPLDHLPLPLLMHQPFVIFLQESLKVFSFLLAVNGIAHPFCDLRREVIPYERLLHLIRNLVAKYVVQILYCNHESFTLNLEPCNQLCATLLFQRTTPALFLIFLARLLAHFLVNLLDHLKPTSSFKRASVFYQPSFF